MDVCGVPTDACGHRGGSRRLPGRRRHLYSPDNPLPGTGGSHAPHRWTGSSSDCPSTLAPGAGSSKGVFTAKWEPSGGSRVELPPLLGAACSLYPQRNTGRGHTPFPTGCSLPSSSLSNIPVPLCSLEQEAFPAQATFFLYGKFVPQEAEDAPRVPGSPFAHLQGTHLGSRNCHCAVPASTCIGPGLPCLLICWDGD